MSLLQFPYEELIGDSASGVSFFSFNLLLFNRRRLHTNPLQKYHQYSA